MPRYAAAQDLQLLLGPDAADERPPPRPLAHAVVLEHRRRRVRVDGVPHRRRTRLDHSRPGRRPYTEDAAVLLDRPAGLGRPEHHRLSRLLLSFPRHANRPPLPYSLAV